MNIQPCKSECVPVPPKPAAKSAKPAKEPTAGETAKLSRQENLLQTMGREPDVRPEEVARGEGLAKDPSYPSDDLLAKLAEVFVNDARRAK